MSRLILSWKKLALTFAIIATILLGQYGAYGLFVVPKQVLWQGSAKPVKWGKSGGRITLTINCGGRVVTTQNPDVILFYLKTPGPIPVRLSRAEAVLSH